MPTQDATKTLDIRIGEIKQVLTQELHALRTDRANPSMVEDIQIDAYGSRMRIKELASVTIPEPRVIVIQPWDTTNTAAISKGLEVSDIGTSPVVQGNIIRVVLPPMTEERRKELTKVVHKKVEEAKIELRQAREEALKEIDAQEEAGGISEDEKFRRKDETQKKVDAAQQHLVDAGAGKEKEILTV